MANWRFDTSCRNKIIADIDVYKQTSIYSIVLQDTIRYNIFKRRSSYANTNGWFDMLPFFAQGKLATSLPRPPCDLVSSIFVHNSDCELVLTVTLLTNGMELARIYVPPKETCFRDFSHAAIPFPSCFFVLSLEVSHQPAVCFLRYQTVGPEYHDRLLKENIAFYSEDPKTMVVLIQGRLAILDQFPPEGLHDPPKNLTEAIQNIQLIPKHLQTVPQSIYEFFKWVKLTERRPGQYHYPEETPEWVTSLIVAGDPPIGEIRMVTPLGKTLPHKYRLRGGSSPLPPLELGLDDVYAPIYAGSFSGPRGLELWARVGWREEQHSMFYCKNTLVTPDLYVYDNMAKFEAILSPDALATETFVSGMRSGAPSSVFRAFKEHPLSETRLLSVILDFVLG